MDERDDSFPVSKEIVFEEYTNFESDKNTKKLRIIHFNDVYNIESRSIEPCGGSSRFVQTVEHLMEKEPALVLFSGDVFSPSNLSMITKGKQMIEILHACHVSAACVGNHDFDFGVEKLAELIKSTTFPWLLSNVTDSITKGTLANSQIKTIIDFNGIKIGVIGLVEEEWMSTLSTVDFDELKYESFLIAGKKLARQLRNEDKVDYVIALTHMRLPNDELLAAKAPEIDLFLGGHDHDYAAKQFDERWMVKSGADFREMSLIEIEMPEKRVKKIEKYIIESSVPENEEVKAIVDKYMVDLNKELDVVLGEMGVELEGRFSKVRSEETNLGNFVCDIILENVDADCCIVNSGSFRSDTLHPTGCFKVRDLKAILPYPEGLVVLSVTGKQIHEALENGVSQVPKMEGRFPQVSGLSFEYDPSKPGGSRIDPESIKIEGEPLELDREYRLATKPYLAEGKDGYTCLKDSPVLVEEEYIPLMFNLVENHFKSIMKMKEDAATRFRSSIVPLFVINSLISNLLKDPLVLKPVVCSSNKKLTFKMAALLIMKTLKLQKIVVSRQVKKDVKKTEQYKSIIQEYEARSMELAPKIERRIVQIQH